MGGSNTPQSFLNVLSRRFAKQDTLLVLDGAPNQGCRDLVAPDDVSLLFLPLYDPTENLRDLV